MNKLINKGAINRYSLQEFKDAVGIGNGQFSYYPTMKDWEKKVNKVPLEPTSIISLSTMFDYDYSVLILEEPSIACGQMIDNPNDLTDDEEIWIFTKSGEIYRISDEPFENKYSNLYDYMVNEMDCTQQHYNLIDGLIKQYNIKHILQHA